MQIYVSQIALNQFRILLTEKLYHCISFDSREKWCTHFLIYALTYTETCYTDNSWSYITTTLQWGGVILKFYFDNE